MQLGALHYLVELNVDGRRWPREHSDLLAARKSGTSYLQAKPGSNNNTNPVVMLVPLGNAGTHSSTATAVAGNTHLYLVLGSKPSTTHRELVPV